MKYIFTLILIGLISCQSELNENSVKEEITDVLMNQQNAWNEGDIAGYMQGYFKSDSLRFASGGEVSYGWQTTFDRYASGYPEKSSMGQLTFSNIDISIISKESALVFGKWELEKDSDHPWGLFSLLFYETIDGWRIVHDHTSSAR